MLRVDLDRLTVVGDGPSAIVLRAVGITAIVIRVYNLPRIPSLLDKLRAASDRTIQISVSIAVLSGICSRAGHQQEKGHSQGDYPDHSFPNSASSARRGFSRAVRQAIGSH